MEGYKAYRYHSRQLDPIRSLIMEAKTRLQDEGFLPENCGISVKPVSYWKEQYEQTIDTDLFEYLCWDGTMTCMWFDIAYFGLQRGIAEVEDWVTAVYEDDVGMDCEKNVARTYRWLQKLDPPTSMPARQARIGAWGEA